MQKFRAQDQVFWLDYRQKYTGVYVIKSIGDFYCQLTKPGETQEFRVSTGNLLTMKEVEHILCTPDLDKYFDVEDLIKEKEAEIENLKSLLKIA